MFAWIESSEAVRLTLSQTPSFVTFAAAVALLLWIVSRQDRTRLHSLVRWMLLGLLVLVSSAVVTEAFMRRWAFRGDSPRIGLIPIVDGTAMRPFVYRRLSAWVVRYGGEALEALTSENERRFLVESSPLKRYRQPDLLNQTSLEQWDERKAILFHVAYFLVFACHCLVVLLGRALVAAVMPGERMLRDFAPIVGLLLLPLTFIGGGFLYDAPELMLLTAFCVCLVRLRIGLLVTIFVLAVLNKESNILLAGIAAAALWSRVQPAQWWRLLAIQGTLGILIVTAVRYEFRANQGSAIMFWLPANVVFWTDFRNYFQVTDIYAPLTPIPEGSSLFVMALFAGLVVTAWPDVPLWLKRAFLTSLALLFPLLLGFSLQDELRNLSIAFPLLFIVGTIGLRRLYAAEPAAKPQES